MLKGKKIVLCVTGSIAAYKAASLVRLFVKEGAEVQVLMTSLAKEFITPLTLATLSRRSILVEFFNPENGAWNSHVDLGLWADLLLVAPATANTMGKMANGVADNLLITTYLSARCPVFIAPAMDLDMYQHPSTLRNMELLKSYGNHFIEPESGELASGLVGKGRMAEPEVITKTITDFFANIDTPLPLKGKHFLVSAGPTHEKIDPVRFIGNYSSGKMGFALAEQLATQGAEVTLVAGPSVLMVSHPSIHRINVVSAEQMFEQCISLFSQVDGAIMAAAVADYTPTHVFDAKHKRDKEDLNLVLKPTRDIAAELGRLKKEGQILVGFALETNDGLQNAKKKLVSKNLDFIVLNTLEDSGAGFNVDTNKITILDKENKILEYTLKNKADVAVDIVNYLKTQF